MLWSRKPFIAVRLLGKSGRYPSYSTATESHLFQPGPRRTWTAVVQPALGRDWELGEIASLVPEEVRLHSAIMLSEPNPWENGLFSITHWVHAYADPEEVGSDLRAAETQQRLLERVSDEVARHLDWGRLPDQRPGDYDLSEAGSAKEATTLLQAIDSSDQLLLAGLARLLGASRLMLVGEYEEASLSLFVAMGASLEFIRQHLEHNGASPASFAEVYAYLRATFPHGDNVADFFEAMYELRLTVTHPANRFGEFWAPPIMASDLFELRKSVAALYRHVSLGEVPFEGEAR